MEPNTVIKEGDAVSVFYLTDSKSGYLDVGIYRTLTPTVNWYVPESYEQYLPKNGEFLIQVTTEEDENFDNPIQQIFVELIKGESFYSKELEELPTTVGNNFIFKVYFFKNYPILFGNNVKTRNVSETGFFQVNMNYSKNSY
jgi:hypothetical protein